eukprot:CAMPEP_0177778886 /NCGR_PEP_ID=MMETSP0491_2-20121128/16222_1 /TAXON_ID=63592 /ORGANISM="Tetraselmis chuii, Strain PLY429" /LENGTH=185 /DNA_ID=CAMNT_0019298247 /DNA_START=254 /DNA_END=807 /DNA_ORIENTATION=-
MPVAEPDASTAVADKGGPSGVAGGDGADSPIASPFASHSSSEGFNGLNEQLGSLVLPDRPKHELELAVSPSARLLNAPVGQNEAWVCGRNETGQLGIGSAGPQPSPALVASPNISWAALAQGERHSAGIDSAGKLYIWGSLGPLASSSPVEARLRSGAGEKVTGLSCGAEHAVAVTETRVYAWGA